ncbi:MAG: MAE_28990/MAE_18760 family HEPN-like nuclease [Fusobacteriaceae bacterium]
MVSTKEIFATRKNEVTEFYNFLNNFVEINPKSLFRILKSNFLLMLYNLVEATIMKGIEEIYEKIKDGSHSYNSLIVELQKIWLDHNSTNLFNNSLDKNGHSKGFKNVVDEIILNHSMIFNRKMIGINGNLDDNVIKKICDRHKIRYKVPQAEKLEIVKNARNNLAHGLVSFSECSSNLTLNDLDKIQNEVFQFIEKIIDGMENYYTKNSYLKKNNSSTNNI